MRTATVRQLRHAFGSVLCWIEGGERVQIKKRGRIVAWLTPAPPEHDSRKKVRFDFMARLESRDGERVFPVGVIQEILDDNRGRF